MLVGYTAQKNLIIKTETDQHFVFDLVSAGFDDHRCDQLLDVMLRLNPEFKRLKPPSTYIDSILVHAPRSDRKLPKAYIGEHVYTPPLELIHDVETLIQFEIGPMKFAFSVTADLYAKKYKVRGLDKYPGFEFSLTAPTYLTNPYQSIS